MPRCAASFVHAVLIIPVPPMNRTFMEEVVAGTWAMRPGENAPNLWQKAQRLGRVPDQKHIPGAGAGSLLLVFFAPDVRNPKTQAQTPCLGHPAAR